MQIFVKTLSGKTITIEVTASTSVSELQQKIEDKEGVPVAIQRLIFGGKQMADDKSAGHYNVEGGSVLHLVLALRGGGGL